MGAFKKRHQEDDSLNPKSKFIHFYDEIIDTIIGQMEMSFLRSQGSVIS